MDQPGLKIAKPYVGLVRGGVEQAYSRMRLAMARDLPDSSQFTNVWKGHTAIVVGGGPSLQKTIGQIRTRRKLSKKTIIVAPNKSHDWLIARGIVPDIALMMDPAEWLIDYMTPRKDVIYFLGSTLDPRVLDKFKDAGAQVVLTHYGFDPAQGEVGVIEREFPGRGAALIYGSSTIGLRAISLLTLLGVDSYILHGFDSCKAPGTDSMYAYQKPVISQKEKRVVMRNRARGKSFEALTNDQMRVQADDFADLVRRVQDWKVNGEQRNTRILAAGDGVIPWMCFQCGEEARDAGLVPKFDHIDPQAMRKKYGEYTHFNYATGEGSMETIKLDAPEPSYIPNTPDIGDILA